MEKAEARALGASDETSVCTELCSITKPKPSRVKKPASATQPGSQAVAASAKAPIVPPQAMKPTRVKARISQPRTSE